MCFVHLHPYERHKVGAQSVQYAFMGYNHSHKGFVCYDISNHYFRISMTVTLFYNQFMFPCVSSAINDIVTLPKFSIMPLYTACCKPCHVYVKKYIKSSFSHSFSMLNRHLILYRLNHDVMVEYI